MNISIAMATHNGSSHIMEQLESFAEQSVLPDELVVCDDCSMDDTVEVISQFKRTAPFEVRLIENEEKLGHVQNFAKAMAQCSGDIVFLSDQDDSWFPNKIQTILQIFDQEPKCWIVVHDGELTNGQLAPSGQTKMSQIRNGYRTAEGISTGALSAIRRDLLKYALPIPPGIKTHDTWLHQLASPFPGRRLAIDQALQYIRRHEQNTSSWVVNSSRKLSRVDVFRAQLKTSPSSDYTDRFAMNAGLANAFGQMRGELTDATDISALQRAEARLASERKAIYSRQTLVKLGFLKRRLQATSMLLRGEYVYFNGIRSFVRDILR